MLKKSHRLNLSLDFKRVASGKRIYSTHFNLFILTTNSGQTAKIGIALAKKEFRRAHERNRARRMISEAISRGYSRLSKGLELVIMPNASVLDTSVEELSNEFNSIAYLYKVD